MTSPALVLPVLRPECASGDYILLWWSLVALTVIAVGMLTRPADWLLLATIVVGAFDAVRWILSTGNIAALELLLTGAGVALLRSGREGLFVLAIGSAAFLKWIPVAFTLLVVPVAGAARGVRALAAVLAVVAVLNVVYLIAMPDLFVGYWSFIAGALHSFFRTEAVYGAEAHPSLLSLLMDASSAVFGRSWPGVPLYAAASGYLAFDLMRVTWRSPDRAGLLPLWGLGLLAMMPRVKPYGFGIAVVPLYIAARLLPANRQALLIVLSCLVPLAGSFIYDHTGVAAAAYGQLYGLAGAYAVVRASAPTAPAVRDILQGGE